MERGHRVAKVEPYSEGGRFSSEGRSRPDAIFGEMAPRRGEGMEHFDEWEVPLLLIFSHPLQRFILPPQSCSVLHG